MEDHTEEIMEETPESVEADIIETGEKSDAISEDETGKSKNYPTQVVLTIRAIVGAYVFYLAYQIVTSGNELSIPMWIAVIVFFVAGAGLVIMSIKHFICKEYSGKEDE